jgi:hypothetical protein
MGMNSFNLENGARLKGALQIVETIPAEAKKGVDNSVDVANDSGVPKLIDSANKMNDSAANLFKTIEEFVVCGNKLQGYYDKMEQALT